MTLKYLGNKLEIFFHEVLKCYIGRPIEMNAEWMVFSGKTMFDIFHKFCTWVDWIYEKQIHIKILDLIDEWHENQNIKMPLSAWLNMSDLEYERYARFNEVPFHHIL